MTNLDEYKVKDLMHLIVESMYTMMERNMYRESVVQELHARIDQANLLTDLPACATVKAQIEEAAKQDPIKVKRQPKFRK